MTSTYDIMKALPGKFNWSALHTALREYALVAGVTFSDDQEARFAEKGIRAARHAAMEMAAMIVDKRSVRSSFIPPSPETLSWGGFLGGENVVIRDKEVDQAVTEEIGNIVRSIENRP